MRTTDQLIEDTLSSSHLHFASNDIASNVAGEELQKTAEFRVLELEDFIRRAASEENQYTPEQTGMEYIIAAYLAGSVKSKRKDSFECLKQLELPWTKKAVGIIASIFWWTRVGYSCGTGPNDDVFEFLEWCQSHEDGELVAVSQKVIDILNRPKRSWDDVP